jgi:hypothetical protein
MAGFPPLARSLLGSPFHAGVFGMSAAKRLVVSIPRLLLARPLVAMPKYAERRRQTLARAC